MYSTSLDFAYSLYRVREDTVLPQRRHAASLRESIVKSRQLLERSYELLAFEVPRTRPPETMDPSCDDAGQSVLKFNSEPS